MNVVILVGRLTKDPEVRVTNSGTSVARFSVAVDREVKKDAEGQTADFPNVIAFGKTAEFIEKYFGKGQRIGLTGRIQTGSYTNKDGVKVYTTDVVASHVEFVEAKSSGTKTQGARPDASGFVDVPDNIDEELPFN